MNGTPSKKDKQMVERVLSKLANREMRIARALDKMSHR